MALDTGTYIAPIKKGSQRVFAATPVQRSGRDSNSQLPA